MKDSPFEETTTAAGSCSNRKRNDDDRAGKNHENASEKETRKLLILIGDNGRRGWMQNVTIGTFKDGVHDDQFGGPEPDNAHLTGVILRLNDDGTTPKDNPFFKAGAAMGGEVGANIQKVFAYGVRNSFGLAFDPLSGNLWDEENGSDSFDEINRVDAGANNGWVQIMGPVDRIRDYKAIEIASGARLQQRSELAVFRFGASLRPIRRLAIKDELDDQCPD